MISRTALRRCAWTFAPLLGLALLLATPSSADWGPPHDATNGIDCNDCHFVHGPSLLKTRGADQETLCQTCHNPTGSAASMSDVSLHTVDHGATIIDCGSCHDPHAFQGPTVDPHAGGGTAQNLSLIRWDVAKYVVDALEPAVFQESPAHFTFDSPPYNGICQACHLNTDHFRSDGTADDDHNVGSDCLTCHSHSDGFIVSCDDCHGNPPVVDTPQTGDGLVAFPAPTGSITAGAHDTHVNIQGIDCESCHYSVSSFGPTHISESTITMEFVLFDGAQVGGSYDGQTSANYDSTDPANTTVTNSGSKTCDNIYCHSNVQSADGTAEATVYTTPAWDGAALACDACHGNSPASGTHSSHTYYACDECHLGNTHVDYNVDVNPSITYSHAGVPGNGYGLCGSACHTGAVWGGPDLMCGDCHGGAGMGGNGHGYGTPNSAPDVAALVPEPDLVSATAADITLEWGAAAPSAGWITEYHVAVALSTDYGGGPGNGMFNSGWITSTSWTLTLDTSHTWYWRVKTRDVARTWLVGTSPSDSFDIRTTANAPLAPILTPEPSYTSDGAAPVPTTLEWAAPTSPDGDPLEYSAEVDEDPTFATPDFSSGWSPNTNFLIQAEPDAGYYWRVMARDSVHPADTSAWSIAGFFQDTWSASGSCPFLYVWDGETFKFQTDLYGPGMLGAKGSRGYFTPNPNDYYVLATNPVAKDGLYQMRLVEERFETDYLDELKLYVIDIPEDRDLFAEKPGFGGTLADLQDVLHTVAWNRSNPLAVTHVDTGEDVSAQVAASDGDYLVLSNDRNLDFDYQTVELDLGDLSQAPQIKLIIDGNTAFPTSPEGTARSVLFGPRTKLEVLDDTGQWVSVPKATAELPKLPELKREFVLDISDIFLTDVYKVRLTFLFKTYINSIHFDVTQDQAVSLVEVPLLSANLRSYGLSEAEQIYEELFDYLYRVDDPNHIHEYFPGNYTRFGDVATLLSQTDDQFVIYGKGDELDLRFALPGSPPEGTVRAFLMYSNGYYKDTNVDVSHEVEPLPFEAMSGFPYDPAVESYPDDPEHNQYREEYNTRVE